MDESERGIDRDTALLLRQERELQRAVMLAVLLFLVVGLVVV